MNKSELKQLIKEELAKVLNEIENEFNNLNDLKSAIDRLPEEIGELEIQSDLSSFQPSYTKIRTDEVDSREKAKAILSTTLALDGGDEINTFHIKSYGGENGPRYIQLSSDRSRKFDTDMSDGYMGKLD